jgi:carboxypeptidase C (cathepsin A)
MLISTTVRQAALIVVLVCCVCSVIRADPPAKDENPSEPIVTKHEATIKGETFAYTATAGFMRLSNYEGKPRANMFFTAYTRDGIADLRTRPILFAFNGGPGSSSVWLHMGTIGPKRVRMGPEGEPTGPPYEVVENAESWLDLADLVFIDPISTGYSRPAEGEDAKQFHGLEEDAQAVGDFIRLYTTKHGRWLSPKFLCGESYGTTRAAALASLLQDQHGMYLNGIILVSPVLNFQTIRFGSGNDTPYWLYVPTYAATAWYHQKLSPELQKDLGITLARAEAFARGDYLAALAQGDAMPTAAREKVEKELAALTGVSLDFVKKTKMRIEIGEFTKELLRSRGDQQGRTVGRLDSRYTGIDRDDAAAGFEYDPSMAAIMGPYTAAINDHVRGTLKFESDLPYEILTGRVHPWSFGGQNEYPNVSERLRGAMSKNRNLHVFVACGVYDLATPHFAAQYTFDTMGLDAELRGNVSIRQYRAGHMMYVRDEDRAGLKRDVADFVGSALSSPLPKSRTLPAKP